jgi:NADP-dependent 3-hydroxy acid dehydrogenase YdfG
MSPVHGKVAVITGGARGVGAEVARRLRDKNTRLVLVDVDEAALTALATELGGDEHVMTVVADVRDFAAMRTAGVVGFYQTVRAALPSIIDRRGYVLIVSSLAAFAAAPASPRMTPPRRWWSTSPMRCGWKWRISASTSGLRTCPGSTPRWCASRRGSAAPSTRGSWHYRGH